LFLLRQGKRKEQLIIEFKSDCKPRLQKKR
jgi:hypothetical protein